MKQFQTKAVSIFFDENEKFQFLLRVIGQLQSLKEVYDEAFQVFTLKKIENDKYVLDFSDGDKNIILTLYYTLESDVKELNLWFIEDQQEDGTSIRTLLFPSDY